MSDGAGGWSGLFGMAFRSSRNPMLLADGHRRILDANGALVRMLGYPRKEIVGKHMWEFAAGGPLLTPEEWVHELVKRQFTAEAGVIAADGTVIAAQWGAMTEVCTGRRMVLVVALSTSRWGARFRRQLQEDAEKSGELSAREREVVRLVALGASGPEIAEELNIAHDTVRTHVRNAMTKLGARSRAHLVAKALAEGHALA
jgi:PAS domain S-box-containing protein